VDGYCLYGNCLRKIWQLRYQRTILRPVTWRTQSRNVQIYLMRLNVSINRIYLFFSFKINPPSYVSLGYGIPSYSTSVFLSPFTLQHSSVNTLREKPVQPLYAQQNVIMAPDPSVWQCTWLDFDYKINLIPKT
jgi:hypothetical protein